MIDTNRLRDCVRQFDLVNLFIEELGWDHHTQSLEVTIDNQTFMLSAIAHKRGLVAFACQCNIPPYLIRRKIEQQVAKSVREHIIIFIDEAKTIQIWQWIKREFGKPTACREHTYYNTQSGELLIQKLKALAFSLEEEEELSLVGVLDRVSSALDVERVTRKFYDRFKTEHAKFLEFINGIPDQDLQRWYASVMLNRLMFIYFIQKKGFIDNDINYLSNKLSQSKKRGKDRFYTDFICPLFFEGFAKKENERSPKTRELLGKVPYLNGGIFLKHQIEELYGEKINIPDLAFERLFNFFAQYNWHLDERPLRRDNEINPDVLGYIFEKYINQKQMGAYYTKEDITEYISKNTIIPSLFDTAQGKCRIAFAPSADNSPDTSVWRLLKENPNRYIYDAVKKGVDLPLPENIAIGIDNVSKRTDWNKPAPEEYALPTEIWREVVARRQRYEEVHAKLTNGEIHDINDFITYNLNIRQFAQDVIENCEGPGLLRAFWQAITQIKVLDPTCGSGAFLFAALNILESLYEACIDRMESFVSELDRSGEKHHPEKYSDFRKILEQMSEHPNQRYFILKSIIINNLYGVDIMDEAIEICKLRLFLKLVAQVENVDDIEPLPDIDFNIRAGNTLVGYATYNDVKDTLKGDLLAGKTLQAIEQKARDIDRLSELFRKQQTEIGGEITPTDKQELRNRLKALEDELNRYLANQYGVNPNNNDDYDRWLSSHKPFHWFIDFHSIMKDGGFDVIIGNPPYVEYSKVRNEYTIKGYQTESCGNLYAYVMERSLNLMINKARFGMIVPLSIFCTERMTDVQNIIKQNSVYLWTSHFSDSPGLFYGVDRTLSIFIIVKQIQDSCIIYTTHFHKWRKEERENLLYLVNYYICPKEIINVCIIPKIQTRLEECILRKVLENKKKTDYFISSIQSEYRIFYRTTGGRHYKSFTDFRPSFYLDGILKSSSRETYFCLRSKSDLEIILSLLNSGLYYWFYTVHSNCRDNNPSDIKRINFDTPSNDVRSQLAVLSEKLMLDLKRNSTIENSNNGRGKTQTFHYSLSKPILDEIDRVLAEHYGFTDEELDFIINYDIKYRMGRDSEDNEE